MKIHAIAAVLAAAMTLPACADDSSPFAGKPSEEIATFIAFGLMDKEGGTIKAEKIASSPFTIKAEVADGSKKIEMVRIVTTKTDSCSFEFEIQCDERVCKNSKLSANFSSVTELPKLTANNTPDFKGGSFTCLEPSDNASCANVKSVSTQPLFFPQLESGKIGEMSKKDYLNNLAARINGAIKHLRASECP